MNARVLMIQGGRDVVGHDLHDVERAVASDGDAAVLLAFREEFDAVVLDLSLPVLDSWMVLATIGTWTERPRLIVSTDNRGDIVRAYALGADLCVRAGTEVHARAVCKAGSTPRVNHGARHRSQQGVHA